jgi:DUF1365 family protein
MPHSAIFEGTVFHRRLKVEQVSSATNAFTYPLFMMYLDLEELESLFKPYTFWSGTGEWNLASYHREDYLGDSRKPLAECVRAVVQDRCGRTVTGAIRVLCNIRYFGYGFNPVVVYYCFAKDDDTRLEAVVLEVSNTPWLEKRVYVLPFFEDTDQLERKAVSARWQKDFHVSPFNNLDHDYEWTLSIPNASKLHIRAVSSYSKSTLDEGVHVTGAAVTGYKAHSKLDDVKNAKTFEVVLDLKRAEIDSGSLSHALMRYPLMTSVAQLYIHWQAVKVFWKGVQYQTPPTSSPPIGLKHVGLHLVLFVFAFIALLLGKAWGLLEALFTTHKKQH